MFIAAIMLLLLVWCPESPVYLMTKKNMFEKARVIFLSIRTSEAEVDFEMYEIKVEMRNRMAMGKVNPLELFTTKYRNHIRIGTVCGLHALQQLSGINAIMWFGPDIMTNIFGYGVGQYGGLIFNSVNFLSTFICIGLIERVGRVSLWLAGTVQCFIGLVLAAVLSAGFWDAKNGYDYRYEYDEVFGWCIIVGVCIFVCGFAYSWGPLSWTYCSEALNMRTKSYGISLGAAVNWSVGCVVAKYFPIWKQEDNLGLSGCFWLFSAFVVVGFFVLLILVPETAGVPLDKMDERFENMSIGIGGSKIKKPKYDVR